MAKALTLGVASGLALTSLLATPTVTAAEGKNPCQFRKGLARAVSPPGVSRTWMPATFHGIALGRAREPEVLTALGTPSGRKAYGNNVQVLYYDTWAGEGLDGQLEVTMSGGIVTEILVIPRQLTIAQAIAKYGSDYLVATYQFDMCLFEESGPVFEAPEGALCNVEYRSRGIALMVSARGIVREVQFRTSPVGPEQSVCGARGEPEPSRDRGSDGGVGR